MAAFLFARALNKTEDFRLASNVDGAGAFDDLVLRYRLREPDVWKTCFIQLKHKKSEGTIKFSSLTQMSGEFSLFKYFESYCQIKSKASTDRNLKQCGPFDEFEFVIYTNARMEGNYSLRGEKSDPVSIIHSGKSIGKCITFDETVDRDIFECFEDVARCHDLIRELDSLLETGSDVDTEINEKIKNIQSSVRRKEVLEWLESLKSMLRNHNVRKLTKEIAKCDFSLFQEFLNKVKIFHSQSNEEPLRPLIEQELNDACKASRSVANSIYTKFEDGFYKWGEKRGNVIWLSKISYVWQDVKEYLVTEIKEISDPEFQDIAESAIRFSEQHMQRLFDAIKQNTFLNIVTNSNIRNLHKLKTYQALDTLGYRNSLFIGLNSLKIRRKEIRKLWPCKWSAVLVIDCDCDGNVADILLDILQDSLDCKQGSNNGDDGNKIEALADVLQKYGQKVILISPGQHRNFASHLRENLGYIYADYTDKCNMSDLVENSQKKILESTVNFQGIYVSLQTLVGKNPPDCIKRLIDSDVISVLLNNEHKLCVGRQLGCHCTYYVPRVLEHHIYLKEDVLKLRDNEITFAFSGLQTDELKKYLPAGEKICEFVYDERKKSHSFKILSDFSKPALSTHWETMETHRNTEQKMKPDDVRYIILGYKNTESDFRELKELCTNVHWIHVEESSFLWRDSKCNIDFIRRNIDDTKCKKYDIERLIGHNERTMLLIAEPGMGKSTFLSHMEDKIKKWKPSVWLLRVNLHEHTGAFDNIDIGKQSIEKWKKFLWTAAHSREENALALKEETFLQALEQTGKMVIILDGFDEISPDDIPKVEMLIREIKERTAAKLWVSSRSSYRLNLEEIMMKFAFTLQPFTRENQIDFLEQYWNKSIEGFKPDSLRTFAEELLRLSSENFSDKDGQFTDIPLQTMMLGEAFAEEAKKLCSSEDIKLPENFNLIDLFQKFTEKKCDIYMSEKNAMDCSKPKAKRDKKSYVQKHMILALKSLFSPSKFKQLLKVGNVSSVENTEEFLQSREAEQFGMITEIMNGKPRFVHRLFAEYYAAKWFTENFSKCKGFIANILFKSTYEVTRNMFDRMLAEGSEIHAAVFNNDIRTLKEVLKEEKKANFADKGGRTALHLAASYNSPVMQTLLSVPGADTTVVDEVLKWTPLRYAERTNSWLAMDILLQNGANPDDLVRTGRKRRRQNWGQAALWECAQKGYKKVLEFILSCGTDCNAFVRVPENLQEKCTLLHIASLRGQVEVVRFLLESGAHVNIPNSNNDTALHFAARSGSAAIIKLLLDKGMSADLTDTPASTPLQLSPACSNLAATRVFVKEGATLNKTNKSDLSPLMMAAYNGKLEAVRYLVERGADINLFSNTNKSALLLAVEGAQFDMLRFLLDNGADINGSDVPWDMRPLVRATLTQNLTVVKLLVENGANLNICATDGRKRSALHAAALVGNLEIADCLIAAGADLDCRDFKGFTPLAIAIINNKTKLALSLMKKGADVNIADYKERTPLHHAVRSNNLKCTKYLVQFGADVNRRGRRNVTALAMAIKLKRIQIEKYLVGVLADISSIKPD